MNPSDPTPAAEPALGLLDLLSPLASHWRKLLLVPPLVGALAVGASFLVAPVFSAKTTFMPPQQQTSSAASALASLGALASLAGAGAVRTPADQYIALMQSVTVSDRIIERFQLQKAYELRFMFEVRKELERNVRINAGKKDGLISVEVDDTDPQRAAEIANRYVEELRGITATLAMTEAQQRRMFFEKQLQATRDRLVQAQMALQGSGFNAGSLRAEPRAAAETYARLKAEATSAEVRLQSLRRSLADGAPEVQQQLAALSALRGELSRLEQNQTGREDADYLGRYREFKYQEKLFELFAQQYELARVDESREGALIQVVDAATPPEHKSRPRRAMVGLSAAAATFALMAVWLVGGWLLRELSRRDPALAARLQQLRQAMRRR